ncbi:acyltransferase domain-containing protein, partial [Acinetobacter baumannii]|nr:acyltransferase domain-containing protein [Acinetobacter baumannii]
MLGIVFAGQGSQIVGMGMDFYHHYSEAKDVFDEADSALGWSVSEFCNETDATRLAHTRKVQAAILTMEIAILRTLQSRCNLPIAFSAGHSLGEYSALVAAGAIGFSDALRLVELRAEIMNKACQKNQGMLAISGISEKQIYSLLQLGEESLFADIACLNGPEQLVLSGDIAVLAYC